MTDEQAEADEHTFPRIKPQENALTVTRSWKLQAWAGTPTKLITIQNLVEDCLERAWQQEVAAIPADAEPHRRDSTISELDDDLSLNVVVHGNHGRIKRTGELSAILSEMDLPDVESVSFSNNPRWSGSNTKIELTFDVHASTAYRPHVTLSVTGGDTQWLFGTVERITDEVKKGLPWYQFFRRWWLSVILGTLLVGGVAAYVLARVGDTKDVIFGTIFCLMIGAVFGSALFGAAFAALIPGFEVYEQGEKPRGRSVIGGAVGVVSFLVGVAGLVLTVVAL